MNHRKSGRRTRGPTNFFDRCHRSAARTAVPVVAGLWSCMFLTLLVLPASCRGHFDEGAFE